MNMDSQLRELEIGVIQDVIDAVDAQLGGAPNLTVPRSRVYASVIYALMASAVDSGHFGSGMLAHAPLLDSILSGDEGTAHGALVFATLVGLNALD
ncbi:hypothetical protein [Nocardia sp. NPDC051750]|uniref:hypothetical protein n=1 Tax=Nocardia sp. NPDC051750 TaxID=3364325 RepID=UPI0037BBD1CB